MLSIVQNREERPAVRNGGAVSSSILSAARSEQLFLLTKPGRAGRIVVQRAPGTSSFSLSLFRLDLCTDLFTITSIPRRAVS